MNCKKIVRLKKKTKEFLRIYRINQNIKIIIAPYQLIQIILKSTQCVRWCGQCVSVYICLSVQLAVGNLLV